MKRTYLVRPLLLAVALATLATWVRSQDDNPPADRSPRFLDKVPRAIRRPVRLDAPAEAARPIGAQLEPSRIAELLGFENLQLKLQLQQLQLERAASVARRLDDNDDAQALRDSIWPNSEITVSWENPSPNNVQEREWVRESITETWEAACGLRFVGWGTSTDSSRGIRIRISDEGPHCKRLGSHLDGLKDGMVLNFNFGQWCTACGFDRQGSIKKIAAHEFGHAIGFAHEQNRSDAPQSCQLERQGSDGDWYITLYDPDSIMNYCNSHWNNNGRLSESDQVAARMLYGAPDAPRNVPKSPVLEPKPGTTPDQRNSTPNQKRYRGSAKQPGSKLDPAKSTGQKQGSNSRLDSDPATKPTGTDASPTDNLENWLRFETGFARDRILDNILSNGAVIASPSRQDPDYYYHWVRDGALTMDVIITLINEASHSSARQSYLNLVRRYVDFSLGLQATNNPSSALGRSLGEPKFHSDGNVYWDNWGRPQDDGPALRAAGLCRLANVLLDTGDRELADFVRDKLYDGRLPSNSIIKRDLEYVSHNWQNPSVDLWEEVYGHHFYTRMAQRRALRDGANLANRLGDHGAADWYSSRAFNLEVALADHWISERRLLRPTFDKQGLDYKTSDLDICVVLGVLHVFRPNDDFFSPTDDRVIASAQAIVDAFRGIYPVNEITTDRDGGPMGIAIGRYPEDRYDPTPNSGRGNPWYLCTAAIGELYYCIANEWSRDGSIAITEIRRSFLESIRPTAVTNLTVGQTINRSNARFGEILNALRQAGDAQMRRVKYHAANNGALAEQFDRDGGFARSARDLTWSYASILTLALRRSVGADNSDLPRGDAAESLDDRTEFPPSPNEAVGPPADTIPSFARPVNRAGIVIPQDAGYTEASEGNDAAPPRQEQADAERELMRRIENLEKVLDELKKESKSRASSYRKLQSK